MKKSVFADRGYFHLNSPIWKYPPTQHTAVAVSEGNHNCYINTRYEISAWKHLLGKFKGVGH